MKLDHIVEEYIACVVTETLEYVLNRTGEIDRETGEKLEVTRLLRIAFLLEPDPQTGKNDVLRSPLFRALLCVSVFYTKETMRKRRQNRKLN